MFKLIVFEPRLGIAIVTNDRNSYLPPPKKAQKKANNIYLLQYFFSHSFFLTRLRNIKNKKKTVGILIIYRVFKAVAMQNSKDTRVPADCSEDFLIGSAENQATQDRSRAHQNTIKL